MRDRRNLGDGDRTLSTAIALDITFKSPFTGSKNIYMYGADGDGSINTGWVQKGTWTPY